MSGLRISGDNVSAGVSSLISGEVVTKMFDFDNSLVNCLVGHTQNYSIKCVTCLYPRKGLPMV